MPDERPSLFPGLVENLLDTSPRFGALTADERGRALTLRARWREVADRLDELDVPPAVQHGDLHDGNVSIGVDGRARFFDFGDASVSHPFVTMLVALRAADSLGASPEDLASLKGAYLDGYADLAPRARLHEHLDLALEIAPVVRVTSWDRALAGPAPPGEDPTDWDEAAVAWLRELL